VIAIEATKDVNGDEANLEMNLATTKNVSRNEANLEVLAIITEDISGVDCARLSE